MKKTTLCFSIFLLFTCCNEGQKREKALNNLDLFQEQFIGFKNTVSSLEDSLRKTKAELDVAQDKIEQAKVFQFLRTFDEREQQIKNASLYKIQIEEQIQLIEKQIVNIKDSVTKTESKITMLKDYLKQ